MIQTNTDMKSLLISILCVCMFSISAMAQINADDVSDQFKQPTDSMSVKEKLENSVYYRTKGGMAINMNNYIVSRTGIVSMPVSLNVDFTASNNFTIGPVFTYLQLKNTQKVAENKTKIKDGNINYHQAIIGVKANWHLMPLIQSIVKKPMLTDYVDVYLSAWAGYSLMFSGQEEADIEFMNRNEMVRGGVSLGVRSMVLPRFGFFLEGGYSSVGYGSFGITVRPK